MITDRSDPEVWNRFHAYMAGFRDGAGVKAKQDRFTKHATLAEHYERGYGAGVAARARAANDESRRQGVDLTRAILRAADEDVPALVDIATGRGEAEIAPETFGRAVGGKARMATLSPEQRSDFARSGAAARHRKSRG